MRFLADLNIARRTVEFLRSLGHEAMRVDDVLPTNATDVVIVDEARRSNWTILTQDLDFSAIVALSRGTGPSIVSLRLRSSRIEQVNSRLATALPLSEPHLEKGAIVTIEDDRIRARALPLA